MRCTCCNQQLDNEETTARYVDPNDANAPVRYVDMCRTCRRFLPPEVIIATKHVVEEAFDQDMFDGNEDFYGEDDE